MPRGIEKRVKWPILRLWRGVSRVGVGGLLWKGCGMPLRLDFPRVAGVLFEGVGRRAGLPTARRRKKKRAGACANRGIMGGPCPYSTHRERGEAGRVSMLPYIANFPDTAQAAQGLKKVRAGAKFLLKLCICRYIICGAVKYSGPRMGQGRKVNRCLHLTISTH